MQVEFSPDEIQFLRAQLARHLEIVENELVHTDAIRMQRELADDAKRLRQLLERFAPS